MNENDPVGEQEFESFPIPQDGHAIESLGPNTPHHAMVFDYLDRRLKASEEQMSKFYDRWRIQEKRVQAYISLPDYEKVLKTMNDTGRPPKAIDITIPYSFATISTIVTYLIQVFGGRQPIFQINSNRAEEIENARLAEQVLQYNAEHTRLMKAFFQYFSDGETYGVQVLRTQWQNKQAQRTVWVTEPTKLLGVAIPGTGKKVAQKQMRTVFQGTDVMNIDPFMFFPDPRVPMAEVSRRGDFVFWRNFESRMSLKIAEGEDLVAWVDSIPNMQIPSQYAAYSARSLRSEGEPHPGQGRVGDRSRLDQFIQLDQGTVTIVPKKLSLGESEKPEKWLFTIANRKQIVQAEPFDADHGRHPVVVGEPYTMGYGFGNMGISDYLGPIQETISWFLNSHMHNVRTALNNMFIVDPSMVEMGDLKNPEPGKLIRLKRAAFGQDVRTAISQLQTVDITRSHVSDLALVMRLGDTLSAVTDNLRGQQDSGGRKTATEIRTSGQAAASRLAAHAKLISVQSIVDLAEQMCLNMQQNMTEDFYMQVVGKEGATTPLHISPEMVTGDFYYPINDGTLPMDRTAMLEVWKEIYLGVGQNPQLAQRFDMVKMFEWIAKLGGAENIDSFLLQPGAQPQVQMNPVPNAQAQAQAGAGNAVPMNEVMAGLGGGG